MINFIINFGETIAPIFNKILYMSIVGTIIGIAIFFINKFFDNKLSAKNKFIIWLIPLIFLLIPINKIQINTNQNLGISTAIEQVEVTLNNVYDIEPTTDIVTTENVEKTNKKSSAKYIIPAIWGAVTLIQLLIFILGNIGMKLKISRSKKCKNYRIKDILNMCREKLKIKKRIEIRFQNFNESPCIYGIVNTKVLIPKDLSEKDDTVLENVFMHELSHYKRKDMLTNYILLIIKSVHWFNPFIHYLFKKIRQDMELATDEIVLNKMDKEEKRNYGLTLINLLEMCQEPKTSAKMLCITDDSKNMEKRIRKIKLSKKYKMSILIIVTVIVISLIIPFLVKPINAVDTQNENIENKQVEQNSNNEEKYEIDKHDNNIANETNIANKAEEDNNTEYKETNNMQQSTRNTSDELMKKVIGEWKPYRAEIDGEEVSLRDIYGSAIMQYGGSLEIKEDGTYTKFIGAYSIDDIDELQGAYKIEDDSIRLISNSGTQKLLTYFEKNEVIIIEQLDDNTLVYFTK